MTIPLKGKKKRSWQAEIKTKGNSLKRSPFFSFWFSVFLQSPISIGWCASSYFHQRALHIRVLLRDLGHLRPSWSTPVIRSPRAKRARPIRGRENPMLFFSRQILFLLPLFPRIENCGYAHSFSPLFISSSPHFAVMTGISPFQALYARKEKGEPDRPEMVKR